MLNLSLNELKLIAKSRGIKGYKSMSKERLLSVLNESESAKSKKKFDDERLKKIRKDFNELRDKFVKPKIKEIRRNLYEIENKKNLSTSKTKEIEENPNELEIFFKLKKYYDYEDIECKGIRDVGNLFNQPTDEDYCKQIKTTSAFDNKNNYIEYENQGDKNKNLSVKEYLYVIRPYLIDMINDHKSPEECKVCSGNKIIDYKTQGEW